MKQKFKKQFSLAGLLIAGFAFPLSKSCRAGVLNLFLYPNEQNRD